MFRKDSLCPHCGAEVRTYFENTEPDDWTITQAHKHGPDMACRDGCEEWSELKDYPFLCEHCMGTILMDCTYIQPCNQNGYVLEMIWSKP